MKKILIICYGYDMDRPNNANAICLNEIIFKIAQNNKIYVITGGINSEYNVIHKNNIIVFNIPINISQKNGKKDFSSWKSKIHNFIKDEFDISKFSILFTISFPFNILQIGYSIKSTYPFLKWVIYELDPYAYNLALRYPKSLFFIRYLMERRIFEKSDLILLTHELYKQYLQSLFSIYSSKFNDVGIPLLKIKNNNLPKINKTNEFNIVYTGSFYSKIRNPDYMLRLFSQISDKIKYKLHLYGPDLNEIDEKYKKVLGQNLVIHGRVSRNEIMEALETADILINIGNKVNNQLPSKVLEYIGTGKPIINFYSIEDDTSNFYLSLYPNSLLIKQENKKIDDNISKIIKFISKNKDNIIPAQELNKIFYKYTIDEVTRKINSIFDQL